MLSRCKITPCIESTFIRAVSPDFTTEIYCPSTSSLTPLDLLQFYHTACQYAGHRLVMATVETTSAPDPTTLYRQLDAYPWSEDHEFQGGLRAILGAAQSPDSVEHLTLRAKCYFYARKSGTAVDFEGYKRWVQGQHGAASSNGTNNSGSLASSTPVVPAESDAGAGGMAAAPKPASFAEICDLIAEGKPIPGIKDIPDTILEGQATESQAEKRKKPWEKSANSSDSPSWLT